MTTLLRSTHFVVRHHVASSYVQVVRTAEPFLRLELASHAFAACEQALHVVERATTGILLDFRQAPLSQDAELDKLLALRSDALIIPFARSAILVATRVGVMQTDRITRTYSQSGVKIFYDEDAAIQYVALPV